MIAAAVTPERLAASERAVVGSLLDPAPAGYPLPPTIAGLLKAAPNSFLDTRLGFIAKVVGERLADGKAATADLVFPETQDGPAGTALLLGELNCEGISLDLAEEEAKVVLRAWQHRRDVAELKAQANRLGLNLVSPRSDYLDPEPAGGDAPINNTDVEAFVRLSKFSPVEYDRVRKTEAKRLGISVRILDAEVLKRRPKESLEAAQRLEPWPHTVNGVDLLNEIAAFYRKFVWFPMACAADVLAVWSLQTSLCSHRRRMEPRRSMRKGPGP